MANRADGSNITATETIVATDICRKTQNALPISQADHVRDFRKYQ